MGSSCLLLTLCLWITNYLRRDSSNIVRSFMDVKGLCKLKYGSDI